MKDKLLYKVIFAGILYALLGITFDFISNKKIMLESLFENIIEAIIFVAIMVWLLKSDKKITSKKPINFVKKFLIGCLTSWLILTILVFVKVGFISANFYQKNVLLLSLVYLLVGSVSGISWYLINYLKQNKGDPNEQAK